MLANQQPEMTLNLTEPSPGDRVLEIPAELSLSLGHALVCVPGSLGWSVGVAAAIHILACGRNGAIVR